MLTGSITTNIETSRTIKATARRKPSESGCQVPPGPSPHVSQQVEKAGA